MANAEDQKGGDDAVTDEMAVVLAEPVDDGGSPIEAADDNDPGQADHAVAEALTGPAPTKPAKARGGSGFLGLVAGGALAAAAGFGLARFGVPEGWPNGDTAAIGERVAAQDAALAGLKAEIAVLSAELATRPTSAQLEALQASVPAAGADPRLDAFDARLTAFEERPLAEGGDLASALAKYDAELAALRAELETQKGAGQSVTAEAEAAAAAKLAEAEAEAASIKAEAEAAARSAARRAVLAKLQTAIEGGGPLGPLLDELLAAGITVPDALSQNAAGVPTLSSLQESFPAAARQALDASLRADMGESMTERMTAFLRTQTGARSLTPREGSDPDAVLSRIEEALQTGDLAALEPMIAELPPAGAEALAEWHVLATKRLVAVEALAALAAAAE